MWFIHGLSLVYPWFIHGFSLVYPIQKWHEMAHNASYTTITKGRSSKQQNIGQLTKNVRMFGIYVEHNIKKLGFDRWFDPQDMNIFLLPSYMTSRKHRFNQHEMRYDHMRPRTWSNQPAWDSTSHSGEPMGSPGPVSGILMTCKGNNWNGSSHTFDLFPTVTSLGPGEIFRNFRRC